MARKSKHSGLMKWSAIALINPSYLDNNNVFQNPVSIADVTIQKKPEWMKDWVSQRNTKESLSYHQRCVIEDAEHCFITEYDAESLGEPDPNWHGRNERSKQEINAEKIMFCNLALWIVKPTCLNFDILLHFHTYGQYVMRECSAYPPLLHHVQDENENLTPRDIESAKVILQEINGLERKGAVWIALQSLWTATTASLAHWTTRYLMIWIALEALFGTNIEISHRISERVAFFLVPNRIAAKEKYKTAKKCYDWRSKIVHGRDLEKLGPITSEQILYDSEYFIRESIKKVLINKHLIGKFDEPNRERYLDELIFA